MEASKPLYIFLVVAFLTGLFIIKKGDYASNDHKNGVASTPKTTDIYEVPLEKTYKKASYELYPKDLTSARNLLRNALGDFYPNGNNPSIYVKKYGKFGSNVLQLSNAIYLAEVFGISKIYIRNNFCYIKKKIITSKGIEIIPSSRPPPKNSIKLGDKLFKMTYKGYNPENRVYEFASETLKGVPKVRTNDNALYIHIRSGDAFNKNPNQHYGQPPLCFYESIIEKWNFNSIYVITDDTKNPVTKKLIERYKAKLIRSEVFQAMGYIINAKNIVTSSGPYVPSLLRLAPDGSEKRIFRYGEVKSCYEDPCKNYYYTDISNYYMKNIMSGNWKNTESQKQIMLNEVCGDKWKSFIYYN